MALQGLMAVLDKKVLVVLMVPQDYPGHRVLRVLQDLRVL